MKIGKWKIRGLFVVSAIALVLGGCQGAKSVPDAEKLIAMEEDAINEKLKGVSREEIVAAWGEPDYDLFGDGDLFLVGEEGSLCVYYEGEVPAVKYVRLNMDGGVSEFTGTILEDYEKSAVIEIDDGYWIRSSGDRVSVDLSKGEELLDVEVGDHVHVQFIGAVMESYPLQLMDQLSISVIDSAGSFEDVDEALLDANTLEGVTMELLEATPTSAKIQILNTTEMEIQFGEPYHLQVYEDDDWNDVPYLIDNWAFTMIAYTAPKDKPVEWDVDWTVFHGELEPGTYRILKSVTDFRGTGDYTDYLYSVEFVLPAAE